MENMKNIIFSGANFLFMFIFILCISSLFFLVLIIKRKKGKKNVFLDAYPEYSEDSKEIEIKRPYDKSQIPKEIDYVIVGSGVGALTCASALSKNGEKVVVVEQSEIAGGCCHSFVKNGYEFSAGIHSLGALGKGEIGLELLKYVTDGRAKIGRYDDISDYLYYKGQKIEVVTTPEKKKEYPYMLKLIKEHPDEENGIRKFFELSKKIYNERRSIIILRSLPKWLRMIAKQFMGKTTQKYNEWSIRKGLDHLFKSKELKLKIGYLYVYVGANTEEVPFTLLLMMCQMFFSTGAYFPINGSGAVVKCLIRTIEKWGSKVFTNAKVEKIVVKRGKAIGVKLANGEILRGKKGVISGAGVYYTEKLIPKKFRRKEIIENFKPSASITVLYCGFNDNYKKMNFPNCLIHIWDSFESFSEFSKENKSIEEVLDDPKEFPYIYITFPNRMLERMNKNNKSMCEIITLGKYDWVKNWKDLPTKNRGSEYEDIKERLKEKILKTVFKHFPQMEEKLDFCEVGTCATVNHWLGRNYGEYLGSHAGFERIWNFSSKTKVKNLVLTGVDTFYVAGFSPAILTGFLTAQNLLGTNLIKQGIEKLILEKK